MGQPENNANLRQKSGGQPGKYSDWHQNTSGQPWNGPDRQQNSVDPKTLNLGERVQEGLPETLLTNRGKVSSSMLSYSETGRETEAPKAIGCIHTVEAQVAQGIRTCETWKPMAQEPITQETQELVTEGDWELETRELMTLEI